MIRFEIKDLVFGVEMRNRTQRPLVEGRNHQAGFTLIELLVVISIVTLLAAMEKYDEDKGLAALCIGGGAATAIAIERVH